MEQIDKHKRLFDFEVGDFVWIHLCKDRFMPWKFGRFKPMVDGHFMIIEKIGENAYKLELPDVTPQTFF